MRRSGVKTILDIEATTTAIKAMMMTARMIFLAGNFGEIIIQYYHIIELVVR